MNDFGVLTLDQSDRIPKEKAEYAESSRAVTIEISD